MIEKPPDWVKTFKENSGRVAELFQLSELTQLFNRANSEYLHWDKFRYQPMPKGVDPKVAWALLKITRTGNSDVLPILDERGRPFSVFLVKDHLKALSYIDSYTSGTIVTPNGLPDGVQRDHLIINGLIEEAISSSQIEGASTTRKVAKAMIELKRAPKNKDEQMILNNYQGMARLEEWKTRKLDDQFLLELHRILTIHTMENPSDEGRFRNDDDHVVVSDKLTGEIVHVPPKFKDARKQLDQLYELANSEKNYIHPFVKASILHYCLAYIHPFVDGNGRSARALFYWFLIKENYWMFKFLPISLQIKKMDWRPGYDRAFQYVETDESDITYFLSYKLKLATNAIQYFIKKKKKKQVEAEKLKSQLLTSDEINQRQLELIEFMQRNPGAELDIQTLKEKNKVAYQTARMDLTELASKRILKRIKSGKKYVFIRGEKFPNR